jgi:ectoine hydroxylase-related dioxygenase (phytanoyl-CoA dioxygenase family)
LRSTTSDERNGTLYFLPFSRAGGRGRVAHQFMPDSHDKVGYFGDDPGIPVVAPAGTVAVTSSTTFHRSGANSTDSPRRAYIAQYSAEPMLNPDGSGPAISPSRSCARARLCPSAISPSSRERRT